MNYYPVPDPFPWWIQALVVAVVLALVFWWRRR